MCQKEFEVKSGILSLMVLDKQKAEREKKVVALSSVLAAIFLTTIKIVVGLITGSLGILSEAAHSGLDLIAAAITFFAVRISAHPADSEHTYGHGKVENLSALFETLLLLVTCVWIIYEAIQRLFFKHVEVEASFWAFLIMGISIIVDVSRSRALFRVAKKYRSQALEADALHFSTDVWSSSVVIVGLVLVRLAGVLKIPWLAQADAVAAMGVAGIVIYVSIQLGMRTITDLLDAVRPGLRDQVRQVTLVPGVEGIKRVRVRRSGPETFADVTLLVSRNTPFEDAHAIAGHAKAKVQELLPGADVVIHVNPIVSADEDIATKVRILAARRGIGAHSIRSRQTEDGRWLEFHLEVADDLNLDQAHEVATHFEEELRREVPELESIVTHIEPDDNVGIIQPATEAEKQRVMQALTQLTEETDIIGEPHYLRVESLNGELMVSFHCDIDPTTPLSDAHALTERVEQFLRSHLPNLGRVVIHVEPPEEG